MWQEFLAQEEWLNLEFDEFYLKCLVSEIVGYAENTVCFLLISHGKIGIEFEIQTN